MQDRTRVPSPELGDTANITFISISEDSPPLVRVFCHVLASEDNSYLAFGQIDIDVQGNNHKRGIPASVCRSISIATIPPPVVG